MDTGSDPTQLLLRWNRGDESAVNELIPLVYEELRRLAHRKLRAERPDHTLNTTALVHEAYLRLVDVTEVEWQDGLHFLAIASRAMRRILVDYARRRNAEKRGGRVVVATLDESRIVPDDQARAYLDLDTALTRLEAVSPRAAAVVEQRFFGGLTLAETAAALDLSLATVKRDFHMARAWLVRELDEDVVPETAVEERS